ncbi:MAG: hypothetical protein WAM14_25905 [Candidatus Nitrosopolaris sp.]
MNSKMITLSTMSVAAALLFASGPIIADHQAQSNIKQDMINEYIYIQAPEKMLQPHISGYFMILQRDTQ